ncbi:pre-mRNA-processing protein 40A-like [Salvia divinorum]|uniref:Pre-mRNA-processing protein 40A-like n=1 Tax=Salvia divinorum TaxID=28513 RepID=A0ABD1H7T5_SALDI
MYSTISVAAVDKVNSLFMSPQFQPSSQMFTAASAEQPHNLASSTTLTGAAVGLSPVPATPLASEKKKKKETAVEEKPLIHATNQMGLQDEPEAKPDDAYHLDLQRWSVYFANYSIARRRKCAHITCGLRVQDDSAIPLKYIHENLRIAKDDMT